MTAEEEDYFNADDDDEDSQVPNGHQSTIPLKRSESIPDEATDDANLLPRKRQKLASSDDATEAAPDVTGKNDGEGSDEVDLRELESHREEELARIREKRKRAEDEEDDADFLAAKKMSQEKDKENTKVGLAASTKAKNVSGKLKLFFGKKP